MKKILLVCDPDHYPHGPLEFVKGIREHEPVFVKGVFFGAVNAADLNAEKDAPEVYEVLLKKRKETEGKNVERFINQCKNGGIRYRSIEKDCFSRNEDFWMKETRYADLMIISLQLLSSGAGSSSPGVHAEQLLRWSDCPVLIVPEAVYHPERIIAAYDGTDESMHAIIQFCKTLPLFQSLPAEFVYIKNENNDRIPNQELLQEYINAHFENAAVLKLHWEPGRLLTRWMECHRNPLLITGAFGRSALSNLLHKSFAELIVSKTGCFVFIAR
ncbi:hypothetical protein A8C56_07420 [Niabella ginsenosidivorans]|uniref:UspA domain-containing protein n=1 Tax=Niabella ginsenosidivorans TaxID=1176587 RepID=A0A1A9I2B8_9BACT|nr:universal stress protein [Niabella ginsenosidivorans]ANH80832.1 hypothetical protein A8C56_07420 [Niabella ginsenosidivorans]